MLYTLGVDIGGTKIATVVLDQKGDIQARTEVASDASDKEKMFRQVTKSIDEALLQADVPLMKIGGIGAGVPGKVDREKGIAVYQNNLPWENFPIVERLQQHYSIKNVIIDNDVYMATYAEWQAANRSKEDTFVYLTISTGISCAIIHQGSFLRGTGFAGEIGLFPVSAPSSTEGIRALEKAASGPAIQQLAAEQFNDPTMTTKGFFLKYEENDPLAKELMNHIIASWAHGIYSIICLLAPHQIVFGGGVINHNPHLVDSIKSVLKTYVIPEQKDILNSLYPSRLQGDAGVIGAGLRARQLT